VLSVRLSALLVLCLHSTQDGLSMIAPRALHSNPRLHSTSSDLFHSISTHHTYHQYHSMPITLILYYTAYQHICSIFINDTTIYLPLLCCKRVSQCRCTRPTKYDAVEFF